MSDSDGNGIHDEKTNPEASPPVPEFERICELILDLKTELMREMATVVEVHQRREKHWTNQINELTAQNVRIHEQVGRNKVEADTQFSEIQGEFRGILNRIDKLAGELCPTIPPGAGSE